MNYVSTRGNTPATGLSAAIAAGLAADGGLYVPQSLPMFPIADFDGCESLAEFGTRLLAPFFSGDALAASLARDGEGPCGLYIRGVPATRLRRLTGPFGPSVRLRTKAPSGPHLLLLAPGTIAP